jgi:2'-5' RNA ligase
MKRNQLQAVQAQLGAFKPEDAKVYATFDAEEVYTLNATPSEPVCRAIERISRKLQQAFPEHYYYPPDRYHVTVKSLPIRSNQKDTIRACQPLLDGQEFQIQCHGVGVNPYGASVVAYPLRSIVPLRSSLKRALDEAINYSEHNAIWEELLWITFLRFGAPPSEEFLAALRELADHEFGTFTLDTYGLFISSSKVADPKKCRLIHTFLA